MTYIAYLDKLGRVGPYVAGIDPRYNDRPVFGLAEFIMPADAVRGFESWMAKRKYELLEFDIQRSRPRPVAAGWRQKGASAPLGAEDTFGAGAPARGGLRRRLTGPRIACC